MVKSNVRSKVILAVVILAIVFLLGCDKETSQTDGKGSYPDNKEKVLEQYDDTYGFEHQNLNARVKQNGKWGIADSEGEIVVACEYDYINALPEIFTWATGVKNGHAVIISLDPQREYKTVELERYRDIEEVQGGLFVNVRDEEGCVGVIELNGDVLLETEYKEIYSDMMSESIFLLTAENFDGEYKRFLLEFDQSGEFRISELEK